MPTTYHARYVVPICGAPIEDGYLTIDSGKIVSVDRVAPQGAQFVDLNDQHLAGGVAILPGLVNAHTHLEFSHFTRPLGEPGMRFPDWIRSVIRYRQDAEGVVRDDLNEASPMAIGLRESIASGVTTIGEITKPMADWDSTAEPNGEKQPSVTAFVELLGLAEERHESVSQELDAVREGLSRSHSQWQFALSPHAPYSTHWRLVEQMCNYGRQHNAPVAMHLAESPDELELLSTHDGAFRDFLEEIGAWNENAVPLGRRAIDYLKLLAKAPYSLVIHGNYLNDEEMDFIASNAGNMSVVFCPRTHKYFGHDKYPLEQMRSKGINIAVGTDSRASSPDLDLMAELRCVANQWPDLESRDVLQLGTINGATALGRQLEIGSLESGKRADISVFALSDRLDAGVERDLLDSASCVATMIGGHWVNKADGTCQT